MNNNIIYFNSFLHTLPFSEQTINSYTSAMRHYFSLFDEVNSENVQKYKNYCLQIHSPKTINLKLYALVKYAEWKNIKLEVKFIQIQEPLFAENLMTLKDYQKILSYLLDTKQYSWYCAFRLLACTGLRIAESYQITVGDLKTTRKVILGKGTKTRVIWFPLKFRQEVLPLLHDKGDNEKLIIWKDKYIRTKLKTLQKKLRLKCNITPHEFRRFYARSIYAKTKDIYLVKDLLGHKSVATTMRYLRVSVQSVSKRMSRLVDW